VFFALAVWPAFHASEMLGIIPLSHAGAAGHVLLERFFVVQYTCGSIALVHLLLEWLYAGKHWRRWTLYAIGGMLGLALFSGLSVEPKLKRLHLEVHGVRSTPQQREQASRAYGFWRGTIQLSNLIVLLGVWAYCWEICSAGTSTRFVSAGKLRG
jgi:hypothetical protein